MEIDTNGSLTYRDITRLSRGISTTDNGINSSLKVLLAGTSNLDFLAPSIKYGLHQQGISSEVLLAPFGEWIPKTFEQQSADVWVIWISTLGISSGLTSRPEIDVDEISRAVDRVRATGAEVIVIPPEPTEADDDPFSKHHKWREALVEQLTDQLSEGTVVYPIDHLIRRIGITRWSDLRLWEHAKAPCHPDSITAVGLDVAQVIARMRNPLVKVVAVDLDDTLWGGLAGEVPPENLHLDPYGAGRPYIELQRFLLDLADDGTALAIVSKNDISVVERVFAERNELVLKLDHFVAVEASWEPKYLAIQKIASKLNVSVDSVCFLDDSKFERSEAKAMLPRLIVPELDANPRLRVSHLRRSRLFQKPRVLDDDRQRVAFYKRSMNEIDILTSSSVDDYLTSLEMRLIVQPITSQTFDRAVSLLHKTNQFNLSLWRPSSEELNSFLRQNENLAFTYKLSDRLGDAGIISVVLVESHGKEATIKGWVLSCRVFSRGVEWAILHHLLQKLAEYEISTCSFDYQVGQRNSLVADVLATIDSEPNTPINCGLLVSTLPSHYLEVIDQC